MPKLNSSRFGLGLNLHRPGQRQTIRQLGHRVAAAPLALAAALALGAGPLAAQNLTFTGNTPIYLVRWQPSPGSFQNSEFQFLLDYQGFCNAHPGAQCSTTTFWGTAKNWSTLALPTAADDVSTPAGSQVVIGTYFSLYSDRSSLGPSVAASLTANGQIVIESSSVLTVGSGSFADLTGGGTLVTNAGGVSTVASLNSQFEYIGLTLSGGGQTLVSSFVGSLGLGVGAGHTVKFIGATNGPTGLGVRIAANGVFVNEGTFTSNSGARVDLDGTANFATVPRFVNSGNFSGSLLINGVKFENNGTLSLAAGETFRSYLNGEHNGRFVGSAGSVFGFGNYVGTGHTFYSGSSVDTLGEVQFGGGNHSVLGSFSAAAATVSGGATVTFGGSAAPSIHTLTIGDGPGTSLSRAQFTGTGVVLSELIINNGSAIFSVAAGPSAGSTAANVQLLSGGLVTNSALTVTGSFAWASGTVYGANGGVLTLNGDTTLSAGVRGLNGTAINNAHLYWNDGNFTDANYGWTGTLTNGIAGDIKIAGDFIALSRAPGVGSLVNFGTVEKTAGLGTAKLDIVFDNAGTVQAQSGVLQLTRGGTHNAGSFIADSGARIELSGPTVINGAVTTSGRVDVIGGKFTVGASGPASFTSAAGNVFSVSDLAVHSGSALALGGALLASTVSNDGTLSVVDVFSSSGSVVNNGSLNAGFSFIAGGALTNTGNLNLAPGSYASFSGGGRNSGTINVGVGAWVDEQGSFTNIGTINNAGTYSMSGIHTAAGGSQFVNSGTLSIDGGSLAVGAGAGVTNLGSIHNVGGSVNVLVGGQIGGTGTYVQDGPDSLTIINGTLAANSATFNDGILKGNSTISVPVGGLTIGPNASVRPGNSPGTLTIDGSVNFGGTLEIELASATLSDLLKVSGDVAFQPTAKLQLVLYPGYLPVDGDRLIWLTAGSVSGADQLAVTSTGLSGFSARTVASQFTASLEFTDDSATPLPSSGNVAIVAGSTVYNDFTLGSVGTSPTPTQIDNDGVLSNRTDAFFYAQNFNNNPGSVLRNRGSAVVDSLDNRGQVFNLAGASIVAYTLTNRGGSVNNDGDATFYQVFNNPDSLIDNRGTLTTTSIQNRGTFVVSGVHTFSGSFANYGGTVTVAASGQSVKAPDTPYAEYRQFGGNTQIDGLLVADVIDLSYGTLTGSGMLQGPVALHSNLLDLGNAPSTLQIGGTLALESSTVRIALAGSGFGASSQLKVSGATSFLNSHVDFILLGGYRPAVGDSFVWLSSPTASSGLAPGDWTIYFDSNTGGGIYADSLAVYDTSAPVGLHVVFDGGRLEFTAAAVPEPESWLLMTGGLALMAWLARLQKAAGRPRAA